MVAHSKPNTRWLRLLCLAAFSVTDLAHAQLFTNLKYDSKSRHANIEDSGLASDQLNGGSTVWDLIAANQKDFFSVGGFEKLRDQFNDALALFTGDPELKRQRRQDHRTKGALRSGDGTPEETYRRQKKFEERERIEKMLERGEVASDIPTSNKMYEMWLEKLGDKPGLRQDDKHDLIPHATLYLRAEDMDQDQDMQVTRPGRMLKSIVNGNQATIHRLEEPYPTECFNHGKLAKQTQKYYMCKSLSMENPEAKSSESFRVTSETYQLLLSNYSDQYSCYTQNVENNVCMCPGGSTDFVCATDLYTRCYLNVTDPPFYAGCEGKFEDSFYYLYSVPGFSPCFWNNFNESLEVTFEVNCQQINATGMMSNSRDPQVGYPYRDVIRAPSLNTLSQVSSQPETEFAIENAPVTVQFDFRDMKYLSQKKSFTVDMNVNEVGTTQGKISLDFSQLQNDDATGQSRYIVGGRTFFEASVFGDNVNSFTFRGFFDQEGYVEPKSTLNELQSSGWLYVIIGCCILVVAAAIVIYCCCKKSKAQERAERKNKSD